MNASDNDFLVSVSGDLFRFLHDVGERAARHAPPDVGDNAVGTEGTASVLHLNKCACVFSRFTHRHAEIGVFADGIVVDRFNLQQR